MLIKTFDNFLSNTDADVVYKRTLCSNGWSFTGSSVNEEEASNNFVFWFLNLNDQEFFTKYFFNLICDKTEKNFRLINVYANGQTYGLDGSFHVDGVKSNDYTFLYYVNRVWNYSWGGATVFVNSDTHEPHVEIFTPNKGVLFPANVPHYGQAPNRRCSHLRTSVAFKLEEIDAD